MLLRSKNVATEDAWAYAPWKDGRERSDRTLLEEEPFTGSPSNGRREHPPPCHPSKEHPPMNSFLNAHRREILGKGYAPRISKGTATEDTWDNAPWKGGSERSERWRETLGKGFPPKVSGLTVQAFVDMI
jgi:hypothetical protein